jgi:hypothetical protein
MNMRPDLVHPDSPPGIQVFQLTTDPDVPGSHVYMEAQVFTPDSKRFVLHRSAHSHGSDPRDGKHQYLVCDIEDGGRLAPITSETGATAPSVSPDGRFLYYFVNETEVNGGRLILKRVGLDGSDRQTLLVVDSPLPGTRFRPSRLYSLSTISSDGRRLAVSAFLGDGQSDNPPFGLMVFDLDKAAVSLAIHGPTWINMHPQYSRSADPAASHDILIQESHNYAATPLGDVLSKPDGKGTDIHVIRDDGSLFRTMPWGRDGNEFCQGHQCWRGQSEWAITSTHTRQPPEGQLIESRAASGGGHDGLTSPGGVRNNLTRGMPCPYFYHFATDRAGTRLITDAAPLDQGGPIFLATFGEAGEDPFSRVQFLLNPRNGPYAPSPRGCHVHPFLSPDGTLGFFNSDESGLSQAYMIRGL